MKRLLALSALASVMILTAPKARAATATNTLTVETTVVAICTIAAQTLTFPDYAGMQTDGSADVTITCNTATPHWVGINNGLSGVREMVNGGNVLAYDLYRDGGRSVVWDNADPGAGPYTINAAGSVQTVFGRIPAGQYVPTGLYTQDLTMTVNF